MRASSRKGSTSSGANVELAQPALGSSERRAAAGPHGSSRRSARPRAAPSSTRAARRGGCRRAARAATARSPRTGSAAPAARARRPRQARGRADRARRTGCCSTAWSEAAWWKTTSSRSWSRSRCTSPARSSTSPPRSNGLPASSPRIRSASRRRLVLRLRAQVDDSQLDLAVRQDLLDRFAVDQPDRRPQDLVACNDRVERALSAARRRAWCRGGRASARCRSASPGMIRSSRNRRSCGLESGHGPSVLRFGIVWMSDPTLSALHCSGHDPCSAHRRPRAP